MTKAPMDGTQVIAERTALSEIIAQLRLRRLVFHSTLLWAEGAYKPNECTLRGRYSLDWQPYSELDGPGGEFRYLAVFVSPALDGNAEASGRA